MIGVNSIPILVEHLSRTRPTKQQGSPIIVRQQHLSIERRQVHLLSPPSTTWKRTELGWAELSWPELRYWAELRHRAKVCRAELRYWAELRHRAKVCRAELRYWAGLRHRAKVCGAELRHRAKVCGAELRHW